MTHVLADRSRVIRDAAQLRMETMRLQEQRSVDLPQSEVFAYTSDFANISKWDPGVASSVRVTDGPVGPGSQFDLQVRFGLGTIPMTYTITEFEPDSRVVLVGRGEPLEAIDEIRFDTQDNLTRIDYSADLTFFNSLRFLGPVISSGLKKVGERALDGLAEELSR